MPELNDVTGLRFGKWTVGERIGSVSPPRWSCTCECGRVKAVKGYSLRHGKSTGCRGCVGFQISTLAARGSDNAWSRHCAKSHGPNSLPANHVWVRRAHGIKKRCEKSGIEFGFESANECGTFLNSITPDKCPVFGFTFEKGSRGFHPRSPSADRKDATKGYTRDNLQVISMKANAMKATATAAELAMFARWILKN